MRKSNIKLVFMFLYLAKKILKQRKKNNFQ
jgi:hypothetical protein